MTSSFASLVATGDLGARLRRAAALTLVCWIAGALAPARLPTEPYLSLFWWPAGVALAALLRLGLALWPAVWVGSFLAVLHAGAPAWLAALLACGHTLGALAAAFWLQRTAMRRQLDRHRDLWLFVLFGLGAGMLAGALLQGALLAATSQIAWADLPAVWLHAWLGQAIGVLAAGVPLLTVSHHGLARLASPAHRVPALILSLSAVAAAWPAFSATGDWPRALLPLLPLLLLPHVLLGWLAARNGPLPASLAAGLVAAGAIAATLHGLGPLPQFGAAESMSLLWAYAFSVFALPLVVAALVGERMARATQWRTALDAAQIGVGEVDMATGLLRLSPRWLEMLGYASQSFGPRLQAFWERVHPDDLLRTKRSFESLRSAQGTEAVAECRIQHKDQRWLWFELRAVVVERQPDGAPLRLLFLARSLAERYAQLEHQQLNERLFRYLDEGLLVTDAQHRVLQANPAYARICGEPIEAIVGALPSMLRADAPDAAQSAAARQATDALAAVGAWQGELSLRRPDGGTRTVHVTAALVRGAGGEPLQHVLAVSDVTPSRQQVAQMQRQNHFDQLTGLPNRTRLTHLMSDALSASERDGMLLTVCYLDLDYFKPVNDRYGHQGGDQLLQRLGERLRRSLRASAAGDDVVARIGGDEFALLLRAANVEESHKAVSRMLQVVRQPFRMAADEEPISVTASIGATIFPVDRADAETLLRHADHAMYGAKQAGRSGFQFFDAEHDRLTAARFVELGRVQEALDAQEFCLHFQPKVDMRDGRVLGVEALLRWNHPEQGMLLPAQFLPLVEHTELGTAVGNWVIERGIAQLSAWQAMGLDMSISINVSARHLQSPSFAAHLAGVLAAQPEPVADRLILEVLETTALADIEFTRGLMEQCRALGVRFALDDFGTGYSTLTYLKRLPLDMLKIDRSFVINMLNDRQDMAIVEGVIGLSETFGCKVVAEGVETLEQAQALIEVGCDIGQGNGIAPAMPAADVAPWVRGYGGMETLAAPLLH